MTIGTVTVVACTVSPRLRLSLTAAVDRQAGSSLLQCSPQEIQTTRTWRTVQIGPGKHVKNEFLAYADHSCDPNSVFRIETLSLVAIRDIHEGDQITFFYPGSEVELAQAFTCQCSAPWCLGQIQGGFYLSHKQMRWALDKGYCTEFMTSELLRLLKRQED